MRSIVMLGLVAAASVLVTGCSIGATGSNGGTASSAPSGAPVAGIPATTEALSGRTFLATGTQGAQLVEGSQVRLMFEATRIGASAGCNQMSGEYEVVDGVLKVGSMAMTEMACDEPLMAQDAWLAAFLPGAAASLADTTLTLVKDGTTVTLQDEEIANPDRPLQGTRWVVTGVVANDAVSSVPDGVAANLTFDASAVAVETGCNSGSGSYEATDTTITFGPIATTLKLCTEDGVADLEQAVLRVLQGEVTYAVDADALTLTNGPAGLILTAHD